MNRIKLNKAFGQEIKRRRKIRKLKLEKFSEQIGISAPILSLIETYTAQSISKSNLDKLVAFFDERILEKLEEAE